MAPLLARAFVILVGGSAAGFLANAVRPSGLSLAGHSTPAVCAAPASGQTLVETLAPAAAVRVCGDRGVLVADSRAAGRFAEGHVANALHLPCAASGGAAQSALALLEDKHTLIVYGDTTDEARPVAEELQRRAQGARAAELRVVVLEGGFPAWSREGLACSSGPCPDCSEKKAP